MSNQSKFINIQQEPCDVALPEEKPIDRVCPTCVPNPSYIPPEWWKETQPWLNEKTCEYSVAVFVNQDGDSYRLSDLKNILEPKKTTISESGIPRSPVISGVTLSELGDEKEQEIKNTEKFDRIKRSFVKTGIRQLLRHYQKTEANEYICARNDCSIFTTSEASALVRQVKHFASLNSDITFTEFQRQEKNAESLPKPIDNPNSLELFANATEHYFYGMANGAMAVLVTVPAHIFDQVPTAPIISQVDVDIEKIKFKTSEFTTWVSKMESLFVLFSKFQAYYNHTEDARLYQLIEEEETPFYAKFMEGRFEKFENQLSKFLESQGYEYYSFFSRLTSYQTSKTVNEIELTFDKSDETRPFKLADTIKIITPGCSEITLKLPVEPDPLLPVGDNIRHTAFFDQTLMSYIANYEKIKTQIEAQKSPPWLDFLVENTFPTINVDYGNILNSKSSALGCLLDKFSALDDYILDQSMSFFDSFAYQYNKNNCRLLRNQDKNNPLVYKTEKDIEKLKKSEKAQRERYLRKKGITENKKVKDIKKTDDIEGNKLTELLSIFNPCNWRKVTLKAVQCLMSGMTIEEGYRQLIKGTIGNLTTEGMELLLQGLPADKQQKVRETIEKEFRDLPAPWEVGYDPGDTSAAYDSTALNNIQEGAAVIETSDSLNQLLSEKKDELNSLNIMGAKTGYENYLSNIETKAEKQVQSIASYEQEVERLIILSSEASGRVRDTELRLDQAETNYEYIVETSSLQAPIDAAANQLDAAKALYREALSNEENAVTELAVAEENLSALRGKSIPIQTQEQYESDYINRFNSLVDEIKQIEEKILELQTDVLKVVRENPERIGFSELTEEEQNKVIEKEKEKLLFAQTDDMSKIKQGTYGKAVGNVQKELMSAYGAAILENASVTELIDGINKLPGAKIIGQFFASFDCPSYQFATPPIDEFLGTFTVGACGKGESKPFLLPKIKDLPQGWSFWESLREAFVYAFKKTMTQVVSALILKTIQTLEAGTCQALKFAGESTQDMIEAAQNGGRFPRSIAEIASDVVCGDKLNDSQKDKEINKLFALSGAPKRGNTTPQEILETMSTLGSESDYLKAMIGQSDSGFLQNVARTMSIIHPDYSELATPDSLDQVLQTAGNLLSEEQRQRALAIVEDPQQFFPLDSSICLTNEEAEQYYEDLRDMFANQLGDPDIAQNFVDDQRSKARNDLGEIANIMSKGPEGILQEAVDDLFADPDPDCAIDKSILKTPKEVKKEIDALTKGIFVRLQKAFIDDTIEENMAERFFSNPLFADSMGVLLLITADSVGYNYAKHMRVRNQLFFRLLSACGFFDNEAPFPETIGLQMRQYLFDHDPTNSVSRPDKERYQYNDQLSQIIIDYDNGLVEQQRYTSEIILKETVPTRINGLKYHSPNFDYVFKSKSSETVRNFLVEKVNSAKQDKFINKFKPLNQNLLLEDQNTSAKGENTFRNLVLKNYLQDKVSNIIEIDFSIKSVSNIIKQINNILFSSFKNALLSDEEGKISNGFMHGGSGERVITIEDLTYVDPDPKANEYTYDNDQGVLGRSLTNNPRIKFLDPLKYGGSYESPNIFIEPDLPFGYLSFAKLIIPSIDGCEPRATNFLGLKQLEENISKKESKIKRDERLSESPECVVEIPFDKISSPAVLATLEQIVTATIRVYLTEFMVNSFSIHGNLSFNNQNYDDLVYEYISSKMQQGLSSENSIFAATYEGYTYWLLFLEQCSQTYKRKIELGEMKIDPEAQQAMDQINSAQIAYNKPTRDSGALFENDFVINENNIPTTIKQFLDIATEQFDSTYAYPAVGGYLVAQNTRRWDKTLKSENFKKPEFGEEGKFMIMRGGLDEILGIPRGGFRYWTQAQMNFSAKIATIAENESSAMVFLKRLIREQIDIYSNKIASELNPRPLIYDINKFFIGGSKTFLGNNIRAGLYDVEVPIGGESGVSGDTISSTEYYGLTNHCAKNDGTSALDLMNLTEEEKNKINKEGGIYLEKYLRIIPKIKESNSPIGLQAALTTTQEENSFSRPDNLPSGVQNINEFIEYLKAQDIPKEANISDWFGDARIKIEEKNNYEGSIGIKFGVRVCYATNKNFTSSLDIENASNVVKNSIKEKAFLLKEESQTIILPLASYEIDIMDEKLHLLKEANEDFNQDLKCHIDALVKTEEFNLVFDRVLNVKKVGSMLACYSDLNFLASIGLGTEERKEPDLGVLNVFDLGIEDIPDEDDRALSFNDSKSECRKLFVSNYKRNEFDPPNEEEGVDELSLVTQKALNKSYSYSSLSDDVPWRIRRRIKSEKPTDKDGKECQNQFGGLFNIKR